jgi:hypothetical protein
MLRLAYPTGFSQAQSASVFTVFRFPNRREHGEETDSKGRYDLRDERH